MGSFLTTSHGATSRFVYPNSPPASERDILCRMNPDNRLKWRPIALLAHCLLFQSVYQSRVPTGYKLRKNASLYYQWDDGFDVSRWM
jgi:hypothetical protein